MTTQTMTVEQQGTLGEITAYFGADTTPYVDDRGYVLMVDGDGDRWEITPSGLRVLVGSQ